MTDFGREHWALAHCLLSSLCSYFLLITLPVSVHLLKLITDVNYKIIGWMGFPGGASGKESACQCRRLGFDPWFRKSPWRRAWQPTPVFLPGESHGQRSLVGYNPWGCTELDMTKCLSTIGWISIHPTPSATFTRLLLLLWDWTSHPSSISGSSFPPSTSPCLSLPPEPRISVGFGLWLFPFPLCALLLGVLPTSHCPIITSVGLMPKSVSSLDSSVEI